MGAFELGMNVVRLPVTPAVAVAAVLVASACTAGGGSAEAGDASAPAGDAGASSDPLVAVTCEATPAPSISREAILDGQQAPGVLAITDATVVDGTGAAPLSDAVVVVEEGIITAVGSATEVDVPPGADVVSANEGTVLPGFIDTHVHTLQLLARTETGVDDISVDLHLTGPLREGLTTIRDLGSPYGLEAPITFLRAAMGAHGNAVPTTVVTGPFLAHADSSYLTGVFEGWGLGVADEAATVAETQELLDQGVDQVKILVDDDSFGGGSTPPLTGDQIDAVVATAHAVGVPVVAHASDIDEARTVLGHCVDQLAHWPGSDPLPDDLLNLLVERQVPVSTTFGGVDHERIGTDIRQFLDAGGVLTLGTDAPFGGDLHDELTRMVDVGMTPMEIIVAMTRDAAHAVGVGEHLGTIEPGRIADLVIVAGDPLAVPEALRDVTAVFRRGELVVPPPG